MPLLWSLLFFCLVLPSVSALSCQITMGYRTNEKPPFIAATPNNKGLYFDLFSEAAKQIGCKLKVVRQPKKRILREIGDGSIDFYPGLSFSEKRSELYYYIANGLVSGYVGISRLDLSEVTDLSQLKGKTVLFALGGHDWNFDKYGILTRSSPELSLAEAVDYILKEYATFYIYHTASVNYHLKKQPNQKLKVHAHCCGGEKPLYLGFSRRSKHLIEQINPLFDAEKAVSPANFPTRPAVNSIAARFAAALAMMESNGTTDKLYNHYFK